MSIGYASATLPAARAALALSAVLHVAALVAAGSVVEWRKHDAPAEQRESQVVRVYLPPAAPGSRPAPAVVAPQVPATPLARSRGREEALASAPAIKPRSAMTAAAPIAAQRELIAQPEVASMPQAASEAPSAITLLALAPSGSPPVAPAPDLGVQPPSYLHAPEPAYPPSSREDGEEGLVVLRVRISSDGLPLEVRLARSSGSRALDRAALAGVRAWAFVPARQGARQVESWMDVPVRFRLQ